MPKNLLSICVNFALATQPDFIHREAVLRIRYTAGFNLRQHLSQSVLIELVCNFGLVTTVYPPDAHILEAVHIRHGRVRHKHECRGTCTDQNGDQNSYRPSFHCNSSLLCASIRVKSSPQAAQSSSRGPSLALRAIHLVPPTALTFRYV